MAAEAVPADQVRLVEALPERERFWEPVLLGSVDLDTTSFCPSASPQAAGGFVFGIVEGTAADPLVSYLAVPLSITDELLSLAEPARPTEVFRFAAPCAAAACSHFDGTHCTLVQRVTSALPEVVGALPACRLRPRCRWWQQEGRAACLRCPQVVTESPNGSETFRQTAIPPGQPHVRVGSAPGGPG